MKLKVACVIFIYFAGIAVCLPRKFIQQKQHHKRNNEAWKHSQHQQQKQEGDLYFNELKMKRSRGPSFGNNDPRNYESGISSSDFFGIQADDSVRLMDYTDRTSPIGHAENFVDPFNDMIEERDVQQFAYNQNQKDSDEERSRHHVTIQDEQRQIQDTPNQASPQIQNHDIHALVNEQKQILEDALTSHHTKHELKNIQASLHATDKDTETQQAKARIMAYTAKHKDDNKMDVKNSSNPYSYLTLPDTQSVEINQKNYKNVHEESKESKESNNKNMRKVKSDSNYHLQKEEAPSSNKEHHEALKDEESSLPSKTFASPTNITISAPLEDTPPDGNAEPVPTEVVEVKEANSDGGGGSESSGLGPDIKNAADEMASIVSSAMPSGDMKILATNNTDLGKIISFFARFKLLTFI